MQLIKSCPYLILFTCMLIAFNASGQPDSLIQKIDSIFKTYNKMDRPGCAVSIIRNDTVLLSKGFGMANLEYDVQIKPSTVFDIASVSKQFTGYAISRLIQGGKIAASDDIRKYLPEVPFFGKAITIDHLLHHSSGLRDWPEALVLAGWRWDEVFSFDDIMRMVKAQKELDFVPGSKYSYSNTGYNLLAAIVEKVSGVSFSSWTDQNIFKPLQMNSSGFQDDYNVVIKNLAYSYGPMDKSFGKIPGALTAYGSSSLFSTVEDLSKWVIHFDRQVKLRNPVYLNMLTEGVLNNKDNIPYNYGLALGTDRGLKHISHSGSWAGYRSIISNYPEQSTSIIILSNSADFDPGRYASEIADLFFNSEWKTALPTANPIRDTPTIVLDSLLAKQYVGTYLFRPGKLITITYEDGKLMTQATGESKFPTEAKSDSTVWIEAYGAPLTFVRSKAGKITMFRYRNLNVERVTPWIADPRTFSEYIGTYYSEELASEYKIDLKEGKLKLSHRRGGETPLSPDPSLPDLFSCDLGHIQFTRGAQRKMNGYKFSGSRIKNISFKKR